MDVNEDTLEFENDETSFYINTRSRGTMRTKAADTGGKVIRLVLVSFGVLCMIQASLNVGLCLGLFRSMSNQKLSEERDELQKKYSLLMVENQNLLKEKEELQTLDVLNMSHQNLSEEELQKMFSLLQTEHRNLLVKLQHFDATNKKVSYFRGSLYYDSKMARTWEESRRFCQEHGGDLIVINSEEEQEFVKTFEDDKWIGLSDRETEGVWKWVDGSPLTISFWTSGEPNDAHGKEDCAGILTEHKYWNDMHCVVTFGCLCELKL